MGLCLAFRKPHPARFATVLLVEVAVDVDVVVVLLCLYSGSGSGSLASGFWLLVFGSSALARWLLANEVVVVVCRIPLYLFVFIESFLLWSSLRCVGYARRVEEPPETANRVRTAVQHGGRTAEHDQQRYVVRLRRVAPRANANTMKS